MVDINKLRLSHSPLTDSVFVGVLNKKGTTYLKKKDVTDDFLSAVISRWENQTETITCGSDTWEITVKKLKNNG